MIITSLLDTDLYKMEPLLPPDGEKKLTAMALEVNRAAAHLCGGLHPITQTAIAGVLGNMNSYYSNRIEGHRTLLSYIDRAPKQD